ncbi:hypothetical protein T440DRAFT_270734 [Plenodomus tracheiphilus IPT5]|uniref:F-box domain-containing protein n=1 Tax=Plenodomus tracheiphilus IPT5 TaxID=1408161 RepID=A0A6A7BFF4_9PLEO|nr:hypothetical protein T440DRAFT_270734 [Plenodomus tracheiphilus IPT5]
MPEYQCDVYSDGGDSPPSKGFRDLPDELLLEIMTRLEVIRAYEPQSTAWSWHNWVGEGIRQGINQERQRTLHAICLTSRRLRRIATPILYAAFTGTSTWKGIEHLKSFHRTVSNREATVAHGVPFSKHLRYIENRLSDHYGNSLYKDTAGYDTMQMTARYFYLLAEIVKLAPNLQHLCVVSLETEEISFWKHIMASAQTADPAVNSTMSFSKLETLCFQINTSAFRRRSGEVWFAHIFSTMASVPLLKELRACGVMSNNNAPVALATPLAPFRKLQRLEITKCLLDFDEIVDLWQACTGLQHITCEWAYLDCTTELPSDLLPGLLRHAETLQTLHLDLREVRFDLPRPPAPPLFGSLRAFVNLRSLTVCERFTSDDHYTWDGRIAHLLPFSLEDLNVLRHPDGLFEFGSHEDRIRNLRRLAEDCQVVLPHLKRVAIHDLAEFHCSELQTLFTTAGVQFDIVREIV